MIMNTSFVKTVIGATIGALLWTGCISAGKIARELGKDNATVVVKVSTIYGSVSVFRSNPMANQTVTFAPDGSPVITSKP